MEFKSVVRMKIRTLMPKVIAGTADIQELIDKLLPYFYEKPEVYHERLHQEQMIYRINHLLPQGVKCNNYILNDRDDSDHDAAAAIKYLTPSDYIHHEKVSEIIQKIAEEEGIVIALREAVETLVHPIVKAKDRHNFEVEIGDVVV